MTSHILLIARRELWKPIEGFNYWVSDRGQVMNSNGHVLKPFKTEAGYLIVKLCSNGIAKNYKIHRLVAAAFVENPGNKDEVNHKDFDKQNNCFENLEWCTHQENMDHWFIFGAPPKPPSRSNSRPRRTKEDVRARMAEYQRTYVRKCRQWRTFQGPLTLAEFEQRASRPRIKGRFVCSQH
ncbi:NUMOD4 domain-containing protein [Phyllobacterium sp. 22229]|uniref:NUMOD4 domain-containing protein n=1 Tax=Phyllobacterium sp. 22229 TaxID=3453895 RepID=UPI003F82EC90